MEDDFGDFDDGFQEPQEDEIGERHVQVVEGAEERLTLFVSIVCLLPDEAYHAKYQN